MKRGKEIFKKGVKWIPGHEGSLNFWSDCWSNIGPIRPHIQGSLLQASVNLQVKDVIFPFGWDWSNIPFKLPPKLKLRFKLSPFLLWLGAVINWPGSSLLEGILI